MMIYPRTLFPEQIVFKGRFYDCEYEWVRIGERIEGSDNRKVWHPLSGRGIMQYGRTAKPKPVAVKKEVDPLEYA